MKSNSTVFLLAVSSLYNKEMISKFECFDIDNSYSLYSSLLMNHKEILEQNASTNFVFCFDEKDKEFIPDEIMKSSAEIMFGDTGSKPGFLKIMSDKYFEKSTNNILIFSNSIGYTKNDIQKAFDLLAIEDEAIVIGKAGSHNIAFMGFNTFNHDLFLDIAWEELNYEHLLSKVSKHENFLHVMGNYMSINKVEDFKNLYIELSKKESLSYCSQAVHERFTNLFIEYKELLK